MVLTPCNSANFARVSFLLNLDRQRGSSVKPYDALRFAHFLQHRIVFLLMPFFFLYTNALNAVFTTYRNNFTNKLHGCIEPGRHAFNRSLPNAFLVGDFLQIARHLTISVAARQIRSSLEEA